MWTAFSFKIDQTVCSLNRGNFCMKSTSLETALFFKLQFPFSYLSFYMLPGVKKYPAKFAVSSCNDSRFFSAYQRIASPLTFPLLGHYDCVIEHPRIFFTLGCIKVQICDDRLQTIRGGFGQADLKQANVDQSDWQVKPLCAPVYSKSRWAIEQYCVGNIVALSKL